MHTQNVTAKRSHKAHYDYYYSILTLRESPSIPSARVPGGALKGRNCVAKCKLKCGETLKSTRGKLMNKDELHSACTLKHAHARLRSPNFLFRESNNPAHHSAACHRCPAAKIFHNILLSLSLSQKECNDIRISR